MIDPDDVADLFELDPDSADQLVFCQACENFVWPVELDGDEGCPVCGVIWNPIVS